jgi:DNA polymerase-4/DNA polymerase V
MHNIVRRYSWNVEEYSVDECFADISEVPNTIETARMIQEEIFRDLGISCSLGLAPTKTLAKIASKWRKPAGFTVLTKDSIPEFLQEMPVGKVWGIGPSTSAKMMKYNIRTALDLAQKPQWWIKETLSKPLQEIWYELNGTAIHRVHAEERDPQKSVMKTRTFKPTTKESFIFSQLCRNAERACRKLRSQQLIAGELSFYLKTQKFMYHGTHLKLSNKTSVPTEIIDQIQREFPKLFRKNTEYRATGVILRNISQEERYQPDLFGETFEREDSNLIFKIIDRLSQKFGKNTLFLAGSLLSRKEKKTSQGGLERLSIPYWGETIN